MRELLSGTDVFGANQQSLATNGVWISNDELMQLPTTGKAWEALSEAAAGDTGAPNLSDQNSNADVLTLAKALVGLRLGNQQYIEEARSNVMAAIGTEADGLQLAVSRGMAAYVISANLVGLTPEQDAVFREWLVRELTTDLHLPLPGSTIQTEHESRPNNIGLMAGASRAAIAAYLGDQQELDRVAQVFKGWLGDRSSYAGFEYDHDLSWQFDPNNPVGINPVGATKDGHDIDGALPEEMRRGGPFSWPPVFTGYPWEALQGAVVTAEILYRAGYDAYNWGDQALLRAVQWLYRNDFGAVGDDQWTPWLIDARYGTHFATDAGATYGKVMGWTAWTHQFVTQIPQINSFSPDGGLVGSDVTLFGTGFRVSTDVHFNGVASPNVTFVSVIELRATVPDGVTNGPISVTTAEGTVTSAAEFFLATDPPILTTTATALSYTENAPAAAIDPGLSTSDADSVHYVSASIAITDGFASGQDVLGFVNQNGIAGSYKASTGVLTLTGTSTVANYQTALRSVTYVNTSENPSTVNRTVTFSLYDGAFTANSDRTISVTAVNDPPTLSPADTALSYSENSAAMAIRPGLKTSDPDSENYVGATVSITGGFRSRQDVLGFTNQFGITGSYNAATGVLTLSGTASVANYQAALRSVTYVNTSDNPSTAKRTMAFSVNDGALEARAGRAITVIAVNDPPEIPPSVSALSYTENDPATAIRPGLTTSDPDSVNYVGATVSITRGFALGQDVLGFVSQNGISGTYNAGTGVLTLTGTASVANYQEALRSVTYVNTSENPSTAIRTVSFAVDDGALTASSGRAITMIAVNDPPQIPPSVSALSYIENSPATAIRPGLTTSDPDSVNYVGATVSITRGFASGQDVLGFVSQNGISGTYNAGTGVLTLTGTASVANYQAALRSVTYVNTSENPNTANRTVIFSVNDGTQSASSGRTIKVTALNDVPTANSNAYSVNSGATLNADDATASTASLASSAAIDSNLTDAALATIGQEGTARWLTLAPVGMQGAIRTVASSITFGIADLPGQTSGTSFGHTILIDRDAAGFGWFIDGTPRDDCEFGASHDASPTSLAYGQMDLLSVVAHEIGHVLGYDHDSTLAVMRESLEAGHRTIAVDAFFQGVGSHHGGRVLNPFL